MPTASAVVRIPANHLMGTLLGPADEYLDVIEHAFAGTAVHVRGNEITADGPEAANVARLFEELLVVAEAGQRIDVGVVRRTIDMVRADEAPADVLTSTVLRRSVGGNVRPKTAGQKRYTDAIANNLVTFGIGPAGTGKSWLAVATAVQALQAKMVDRIVLTRPAVEAGERLGFLPGDLMAKVDPYLRPLYDALHDMVGAEGAARLLERGTVEVAPLAFMRGRTLNSSFIILDEAQNTTPEQMKMFLTRIGFGSKAVITGDRTQKDVGTGRSGLDGLAEVLEGIDGVAFVELTRRDVVRHRIVAEIVDAYERFDARTAAGAQARGLVANPAEDRTSIDPARSISVEFDDARECADPLPVDPARLMELLGATLEAEGVTGPAQVGLTLIDPAEIAQLNVEHLGGEGPTDVLSFPLEPFADPDWPAEPGEPARLIGDVVVCPAVAEAQAAGHAGSPADELALLVVHAGLHLAGHDHAEPAEAAAMVTREREILKRCWGPLAGDPWATP